MTIQTSEQTEMFAEYIEPVKKTEHVINRNASCTRSTFEGGQKQGHVTIIFTGNRVAAMLPQEPD